MQKAVSDDLDLSGLGAMIDQDVRDYMSGVTLDLIRTRAELRIAHARIAELTRKSKQLKPKRSA